PSPLHGDPTAPIRAEAVPLPPHTTLGRLQGRIELRSSLAARSGLGPKAFDGYYGKALSLIASARAQKAFRLEDEEPRLRARYGRTRFGQSCLLARRLIEAGARFVPGNRPPRFRPGTAPRPAGPPGPPPPQFPPPGNGP